VKKIIDFKVSDIKWLSNDTYLLDLFSEENLPEILPGSFAEIKINKAGGVFLRRPFSIHDVDYEKNIISFFIKIAGKGTSHLAKCKEGDKVNVILPLGNFFSFPEENEVLLIGGGSGIAPLKIMGKQFKKNGASPTFLIGGKSKNDIFLVDELSKYGEVFITTEDGSLGEKGFVTHHSVFDSVDFKYKKIYTCGPEPMMKTIAKFASENNIECEVSLENTMACGIGACLCCVVDTKEGNKCVCIDGPVFNIKDLKWQI